MHLKMSFIPVMQTYIFSIITPVFTWSFDGFKTYVFVKLFNYIPKKKKKHTLRSSTFLAAVTMPSRHFETMGTTLRSTSAKLRYISPSFTVRRSSMFWRFCMSTNTELQSQKLQFMQPLTISSWQKYTFKLPQVLQIQLSLCSKYVLSIYPYHPPIYQAKACAKMLL